MGSNDSKRTWDDDADQQRRDGDKGDAELWWRRWRSRGKMKSVARKGTARDAEPVKGEANLQEEVDSTTRRGVAVDGVEDGQGVVATVQTLTATIDPHQQQTATNYDKLMVLQGSWFAGYWFPWEEHAHRNGELKQGKAVARSNGDQSMRKMVLLIGDGSSWRCSVRMQVVLVLN